MDEQNTQIVDGMHYSCAKHEPGFQKIRKNITEGVYCRKYAVPSLESNGKTNGTPRMIDGDIQVLYNLANNLYKASSFFPKYEDYDKAMLYLTKAKQQMNLVRKHHTRLADKTFLPKCITLYNKLSRAKSYVEELKKEKEENTKTVDYDGRTYHISFPMEKRMNLGYESNATR